jgi:MtN3 and saliva related transmembrane protein
MEIVGWAGFALTQIFYIPQIVKILRNRDVSGLALPSWFILAIALLLYLVYSVWRHDLVFIVGNAAGMVQSFIMIALILKYRGSQAIKQSAVQ